MTAVIADPRNDEHLVISGLHCAFMKFHNQAAGHSPSPAPCSAKPAPARRTVQVYARARSITEGAARLLTT